MSRTHLFVLPAAFVLLAACGDGGSSKPSATEATLTTCQDEIDNDGDGWIDCDDQDCQIFAVCVSAPDTGGADTDDAGTDVTDASDDTGDADDADAVSDVPDADTDTGPDDVTDTTDAADVADASDTGDTDDADDGETTDATDTSEDTTPTDPCAGADLCLESTFTLTANEEVINGIPSSNTFVPLLGQEVRFAMGCDIVSQSSSGSYFDLVSGLRVEYRCTIRDAAVFAGSSRELLETIVGGQVGRDILIGFADSQFWSTGQMAGVYYPVVGYEGFTLEWVGFDLALLGDDGSPELTPFEAQATTILARRFVDDQMADFATGTATLSLTRMPLD